jgi:sugar O-acyltransferase (sialic acid O-acetyltransferase NeuD family)
MNAVILGAGGQGRVVLDILRAAGEYEPVAFLDANATLSGTEIGGVAVRGSVNLLPRLAQHDKIRHAIVAIGDNRVRRSYAALARDAGMTLINAIHPQAAVSPTATLGTNLVISPGAVVATDASIGDSVIVNSAAVVDHECRIGEGSHICPGALLAGRVRVGAGAFIGMGAKIIQCLSVGDEATVGAGAVVLADVPPGVTVAGVPARVIRSAARAAG